MGPGVDGPLPGRPEPGKTPNSEGDRARGTAIRSFQRVRWTQLLPGFLALALLLLLPFPSSAAEQSGRWWWESRVALAHRGADRGLGSTHDQELDLSFGLNGFILHPRVARFRIDLDFLTRNEDLAADSDRLGVGGRIDLFPKGRLPTSLYFRRSAWDFARSDDGPTVPLSANDLITQWGGTMRVRKGAFRGLQAGMRHVGVDFLDSRLGQEVRDNEFLAWNRTGPRLRHRARLERRAHEFRFSGQEIEDYTLYIQEQGDLTPDWYWSMSGTGILRELIPENGGTRRNADYRLRNQFMRDVRSRDRMSVSLNLGLRRPHASPTLDSQALAVSYGWRPRPNWDLGPFVRYTRQRLNGRLLKEPRAGLSATWRPTMRGLDATLTARGGYGVRRIAQGGTSMDERGLSYAFVSSLGQGEATGLRKQLEVEFSHDELNLSADPIIELPDFGLPDNGFGTNDLIRGRLSLSHRWTSNRVKGWGQWLRREYVNGTAAGGSTSTNFQGGMLFGGSHYSLQANSGESRYDNGVPGNQEVRYVAFSAHWSPWFFLSLRGSYRQDRRMVPTSPVVEGEDLYLAAIVPLGQLNVEGSYSETELQVAGSASRMSRTLRLGVSMRFAGWLPIETGTRRRGVIR